MQPWKFNLGRRLRAPINNARRSQRFCKVQRFFHLQLPHPCTHTDVNKRAITCLTAYKNFPWRSYAVGHKGEGFVQRGSDSVLRTTEMIFRDEETDFLPNPETF